MIVWTRTSSILPGKLQSALALAHEINAYIKDAHGLDLELLMPLAGNPGRITWVARHADLAAFESVMDRVNGDKRYWEIAARLGEVVIAGSANDTLWRTA